MLHDKLMVMKLNIHVVIPHLLRIKRMKKGFELWQKPQTYVYTYNYIFIYLYIIYVYTY